MSIVCEGGGNNTTLVH